MNKSELIDTLSKKEGLTEKQAADVVNLIFKGFGEQLKRGGRIEIRGFGSFCCKELRSVHGKKSQDGRDYTGGSQKASIFQGR